MLTAQFITTEDELVQVAQLSAGNLVSNISAETSAKEGFVSWSYPLATLQLLHAIQPSVIVKDNSLVAGYALVLTWECIPYYPAMETVLTHMQSITYKGRPLTELRTYLMGQICVHPDYRGKGIVDRLYQFHRQAFSSQFDYCVTEISTSNKRSLKAHQKTGFCVIDTYRDEQDEWDVVLWDWSDGRG
jgi:ribosomal protein S18 acetylase RimI-like enzyme